MNLDSTDIRQLSKYFTYVFVQPHYYQTWRDYYIGTLEGSPDDHPHLKDGNKIDALLDVLKWIQKIPNGYIEMEVDETINSYPELINKACDYIKARESLTGRDIWQIRAYYFDTDINNVDKVRKRCSEW